MSVHDVPIRLTDTQWEHIVTEHPEMQTLRELILDAVSAPEQVMLGAAGEQIGVREIEAGKWLVAIYREADHDGFVITAFLTRRKKWFEKREVIWPTWNAP